MALCQAHPPLSPDTHYLLSRYGIRPGRTSGLPTFHAGLDFGSRPASVGDPVYLVAPGRVVVMGQNEDRSGGLNGYGNCVAVLHDLSWEGHRPLWTFYAHMQEFRIGGIDLNLEAGTVLGLVGNTTNGKFPGMGPHLHFELRHAARGDASPLPGPYRTNNLDPEPWLASLGITFGRRGEILWERRCVDIVRRPLVEHITHPWRSSIRRA